MAMISWRFFERSFHNIENEFTEKDGKLRKAEKTEEELA